MRISFPNKERDDTLVGFGDTRIGAADDNGLVLHGSGVASHHIRIKSGERGIELGVLDAQARTHVNTRPVREKAILRLGDVISLGSVQIVLKPDDDADVRTQIPPPAPALIEPGVARRALPPRVILRGLSGMHFGKIVAVRDRLVVGAQGDLKLDDPALAARHAAIESIDDKIVLRGLDAGTSVVNGVETRDAILHGGDQIVFGRERFLVEAPSMAERAASHDRPSPDHFDPLSDWNAPAGGSTPPSIADDAETKPSAAGKNDIWWLIAAAALIAGGFALFFLGII
jgi:hypothetical protein